MNAQFQQLKDSLYKRWWSETILFDVLSISPTEWEAIRDNPSDYFNRYIQRFPLLVTYEAITEIPTKKHIWKEKSEEEAKRSLNRMITICLAYESNHFPEAEAKQLIDDVICQFSPSVRYFRSFYDLTESIFEEQLVIVDEEKLLFVLRMEDD